MLCVLNHSLSSYALNNGLPLSLQEGEEGDVCICVLRRLHFMSLFIEFTLKSR